MPTHTPMPVQTTGHITPVKWEEPAPAEQGGPGPRLARASVINAFSGGIEAVETACEYVIAYVTAKTGTFTGMEVLSGRLDGRDGTFVVEERGRFDDDGTVHCTFEVVPGSGTAALTGLRGTGTFTARHGERSFPYTFGYDLDRL